MAAVRRILRGIGWAVLALVGLVGVLLVTLFFVGRSDWGRRQILNAVLPAVRPVLTGELRVGALDGDLTHMLVLRDVELTDAEGQVAVHLSRLGLRYNLLALLGRTLHVTAADGSGELHVRHLRDGDLNLARLVKPSEPTGPLPLRIQLGGIALDLTATYDPPKLPRVQAGMKLHASLALSRDRKLSIETDLDATVATPAQAQLHVEGALASGPGTPGGLGLKKVQVAVKTSGEELDHVVSALGLRGPLSVKAELDGSLASLGARAELSLPTGKVTLRGSVRPLSMEMPWELAVKAEGVDPSVRAGLPSGKIDLDASLRGFGLGGRIDLGNLQVSALATDLQVSGWATIPTLAAGWRAARGELHLTANAKSLAQLAQVGLPSMSGTLQLSTHLKLQDQGIALQAALNGRGLAGFGASLDEISLSADAAESGGKPSLKSKLAARGLAFKGQRFAQLSLEVSGSHDAVQLRASGDGPEGVAFLVAAGGRPAFAEPASATSAELRSLDVEVTELRLARAAQALAIEQPARVRLDLYSAPIIDIEHLSLALTPGAQRLTLDAHYETAGGKLRAKAAAQALDVKQLLHVAGLAAAADVPATQLELAAQVGGTVKAPVGQLTLSGEVGPPPQLPLPRTQLKLTADLSGKQARGELAVKTLSDTAASEAFSVSARFAMPFSDREPLSVDATLETSLPALQLLLPQELRSLTGALTLHATAGGTIQRPELGVRLQLPKWSSDWVGGKETLLIADYHQQRLVVQLGSQLMTASGEALGGLKLGAQAPLLLSPQASGAGIVRQLTGPALRADLTLSAIELKPLWKLLRSQEEPPLAGGQFEVSAQLSGPLLDSVESPTLNLTVSGRDLLHPGRDGLPGVKMSGALRVAYSHSQLGVDLDGDVAGKRFVQGRVATTLRLPELLADSESTLRKLPLKGVIDVLPTELPESLPVRGQFRMHSELAGSVGRPQLLADLNIAKLFVHDWQVGDVAVHASADGTSLIRATATVQQDASKGPSGSIKLTAAVPLPFSLQSSDLQVDAQIHGYRLNYEPPRRGESYGGLLLLRGLLDAELVLKGRQPQPQTAGFLRFSQGEVAASALPELFRDILVDLKFDSSGLVTLRKVAASAESGRVSVDGSVQLDGLLLRRIALKATASAFPLAAGPIGLWIDSKVDIQGQTVEDTLRTKVVVTGGTLRLPKLSSGQSTQPLGPLEDIRFVDATARRAAAEAERRAAEAAHAESSGKAPVVGLPRRTLIAIELPPPFNVVGPEVKTELEGHFDIELTAPAFAPIITGALHTNGGWVEILDGRYQVERVQVAMSGETPPNPLLDVLISRKLDDVTLYVQVSGSARKPKLSFSSDPATYDESQVLMMVISGGKQRGGNMQQQAIGALSSLLVGQLRKQLGPLLPVDELRLNAGGSDPMGMNQSSLEVGKYIRDDLFLLYTHRFGNWATSLRRFNNDEVSLEYRFLTNYQINLMAGDQGVGALNFYWTKRF